MYLTSGDSAGSGGGYSQYYVYAVSPSTTPIAGNFLNYVSSGKYGLYPNSGVSDGYYYTRTGLLGGSAKVVTGNYVGNGTNERALSFAFPPKLLFVTLKTYYGSFSSGMFLVCNYGGFAFGGTGASISSSSLVGGSAIVSKVVDTAVIWKNTYSADIMENQSGGSYTYVAIL